AEEAGRRSVGAEVVEFAHPVYASTVRAGIPPGVRRRRHRALADVVADPDERARHLALCTAAPDAAVARVIADAAGRQEVRGAPEIAAQLYERAAQLTPADEADDRGQRRLAAARCRFDSGDYRAAAAAAEQIAGESVGDQRAESLLLRAIVAWSAEEPTEVAVAAAERALAAVSSQSSL